MILKLRSYIHIELPILRPFKARDNSHVNTVAFIEVNSYSTYKQGEREGVNSGFERKKQLTLTRCLPGFTNYIKEKGLKPTPGFRIVNVNVFSPYLIEGGMD